MRWLRRVLFWSITTVVLLMFVLIILLQTPVFQNYLGDKVLTFINSNTRQTAKFTNIKIKWFDFVEIKNLKVYDYKNNLMVSASNLKVDYQLSQLLVNGGIVFDQVVLDNSQLILTKYQDSLGINLAEFINDLNRIKPQDTTKEAKPFEILVGQIGLNQFKFSYNNQVNDSLPASMFDYGHFQLDVPAGWIEDFRVASDTIQAKIETFEAIDRQSGLQVDGLKTNFQLSSSGLELREMNLVTANSKISDQVLLFFNGFDDLGHFADSVKLDVNLVDSRISKKDIDYFAHIPGEDFMAYLDVHIQGSIPDLSMEKIDLQIGDRSMLQGSIDFMGLPNIDETFIDARIERAELFTPDLSPFVDQRSLAKLGGLRDVVFNGHFLGFTHDFVAKGDFDTDLGKVSSDVNLKFSDGWGNANYSGDLHLSQFDIGKLIQKPEYVGKVNMKGTVNGTGVQPETAKVYLDATFLESQVFGYTYDSIKANGELASEFFKGRLIIGDPNCRINTSGQIDLSGKPEEIKLESNIEFVDLHQLGFSDDVLTFHGKLDADILGLDMDSLQGKVNISDLNTHWKEDSIRLDSVLIYSFSTQTQREIAIELPDLKVDLKGNFYFSQLINDIKVLSREVRSYFNPDYSGEDENFRNSEDINQYSVEFTVDYNDISKYVDLLETEVYISPKGLLEGTYYQRRNATLALFTEIDSINYDGVGYTNNTFDINFSKDLDSAGIIASVFVNSGKQIWRKIPETRNFSIEAIWFNKRVNITSSVEQPQNNSSAHINSELKIQKDRLVFNINPSKVIIFGDQWFFNPFNKVNITENNIIVERLELYQNAESIALSGNYSDSSNTQLNLKVKDFDLMNIRPLIGYDVEGILNSTVEINRVNLEESFVFDSELKLDQFKMNDFLIGNINGESQWNSDQKRLAINYNVRREGVNTIDINGYYSPKNLDNELDINARFNQASLQLANPFLQSLFSDIGGYANGEVDISGSVSHPIIIGSTEIESGTFKFDYLGTTYGFNGNIALDNKSIKFNGVRLLDKDENRASFSGVIKHTFFKDFQTDLRLAVSDFQLLNTSLEDNSLYYGTANATGDIDIIGPVDDLLVRANVTTNKGTKLYIPLSGSTSDISQKDYISFVDITDTTQSVNIEEIVKNSISGVRLDFEVDVTPDAYVELIFDIRTGDIIRGRGNGNINLSLDTNGEFELFGDLSITEGAYNFTIPNFINKEFTVVPGSTITWYGDPYAGILNLSATYRQLASPMDYIETSDEEEQGIKQKYPVLVVVKLNGEMLSPDIDFEIRLEDSQASPTADVERVITSINSNEQELKRQVFSLLILRKISPQTGFELGAGAVQGSLSEFFSNQFSYFISQVDENLEVDVDLSSLDQNAFNTFQLRLSYTFLDGRLRVSGGGGIPQGGEDASTSNFIGDWSVRYLLTPDGHLRVKAFSQTEQLASSFIRETGVSFQYLKSFNDFRDLITKSREESIATKPKDVSKEIEANKKQKPSSK